jgi:hypothetical protein
MSICQLPPNIVEHMAYLVSTPDVGDENYDSISTRIPRFTICNPQSHQTE